MSKFYFLSTVKNGSGNKLRPLSGQTFDDGTPVNETVNCAGDHKTRKNHPIGTVFGTDSLELAGSHYIASILYPLDDTVLTDEKEPSRDMVEEWNRYKKEHDRTATSGSFKGFGGLFDGLEPETPETTHMKKAAPAAAKAPKTETKLEMVNRLYPCPTIKDDDFFVKKRDWEVLALNVTDRINTMLTGPCGTGKTELVMEVARRMNYECCIFDMGSMHDPMTQMLGTHRIDADHKSVFEYAKFVSDVSDAPRGKTKGRIVLLDELSRAPQTTLNILFPCLDSRRSLPVEMAGEKDKRNVKVNDNVIFVATANIGAEYTGTGPVDKALRDRFTFLPLDYMPVAEESKLLVKRTGIKKEDADNIVAVCDTIRGMKRKETISEEVSTRNALQAARLVSCGYDAMTALEISILPLFEGTDTYGERSLVRKTFMTR